MTQDETWLLTEKYHGEKTEGFFADCTRLATGEPLAYVIGSIPFLHITIYLDTHPLIPRTETEFWVEKVTTELRARNVESLSVLDLCAGSGAIGVAVLRHVPSSHVDFVEIDMHHHLTIQKNITANAIDPKRTRIWGGDLFEHVTDTYDVILTNPPYIDPSLDRAEESVKKYEPDIALYGGVGGMEILERIIQNAPQHLHANGLLIIEHEPEQTTAIHSLGKTFGFTAETHADQFGLERVTYLKRISA